MGDEKIQQEESPVEIPTTTPPVEISVEEKIEPSAENQDILPVSESTENSEEVMPGPTEGLENKNNDIKNEAEGSNGVLLEEQKEEPVAVEEVPAISETFSDDSTPDAISDTSPVETENPKVKQVEVSSQNIKPISSTEHKEEGRFLCNPLSDSFLRNIKNFEGIRKKGREAIFLRKQKRLDRIMTLFLDKNHITLSEVEKFLRVTEKTASKYITELKKQNKIKKSGKDDRGAFLYVKI